MKKEEMKKRERMYLARKKKNKVTLKHEGYLKLTQEFIEWAYTPEDYKFIYENIKRLG